MKVVRVHATGDAGALRLEEADVPRPGPGQALLRLEAVGLNYVEIYHRTGLYKLPLPFTPGSEAAGTVEAVGRASPRSGRATGSARRACLAPMPSTRWFRRTAWFRYPTG